MPDDGPNRQFPTGAQARLAELLDRQDRGEPLSDAERFEAESLVAHAELLSLLRLKRESLEQ